jgi:hypothetical protein
MFGKCILIRLCLTVSSVFAQQGDRVNLGHLQTGETVSFIRAAEGEWGIEISGATTPRILQPKPAKLEIFRTEADICQFATGYKTVEKSTTGINALAEITYSDNVVFRAHDRWSLSGAVVSVNREVEVTGNTPGGFYSSIVLALDPSVSWPDVKYMAPGALYGDPTYNGAWSPGGTLNNDARCFVMREDVISAPLFAISFGNGASVAMLNPAPRGDTTRAESSRSASPAMTDARFQFGALGAWQTDDNPIEFGYRFPGTVTTFGRGRSTATKPRWIRRYHPITSDVDHRYQVSFRFGKDESFPDVTRSAWRWAWGTLKPAVTPIDVEQMRRVLIDHLAAQVNTIDGRTAIPFVINTISDQKQWNYTMVAMGFVGKNIECADQLLREGDRDRTERGRKMRQTGLAIISSHIQALATIPLQGTGYDLATGKPWTGDHQEWVAPWLRNATEGMAVLMRAYRRERKLGRLHPDWFDWMKTYVDWLIQQQRPDGSFPRCWKPGSNEVEQSTGTASYCPVPLLVMMSEETGDAMYKQAAVRAAEYVWTNWGSRGLFIGGAIDNPNITDKEAGMLSLEAFLSLYESTKDTKWLKRAQTAADFTESWIWIWDVPMPMDANDADLHWKKGVPALGFQGITALHAGSVDEYLDWAVPSYAKLYNLTKDQHYLDVARVLLHDTKQMVALPGHQYDYKGIGWQQEGWRMGPGGSGRGVGGHRFWLPWISTNHLYGITGLEEYDPALFKNLSVKPEM